MSFFFLVIKNIFHKPLNAFLSILLFALGIGLVSSIILVNHQLEEKFNKNLANIDLVIGAKGSPLQMILCSMYHIDAPTGNIKLDEVKPFLNPNHPLFSSAIPLSLGDSYKGFRIVGSNQNFFDLYSSSLASGRFCDSTLSVTLGANIAKNLNLKIGDTFKSNHGLVNDGLDHEHNQDFKVVGILNPTSAVIDQLIITPLESIWDVHDEHESHKPHNHEGEHNHEEHKHEHKEEDIASSKMITSVLIKYKSRSNFQTLNLGRNINENTNMQAASPAIELNRLYSLLGIGEKMLKTLALIVILVSGISIFISLFNSLKERKYELSLLRTLGASKLKLFGLVLLEAFLLSLMGCILGLALSHCGMYFIATQVEETYQYSFQVLNFLSAEIYLIVASVGLGIIAGLIPAWLAYRIDIANVLGK